NLDVRAIEDMHPSDRTVQRWYIQRTCQRWPCEYQESHGHHRNQGSRSHDDHQNRTSHPCSVLHRPSLEEGQWDCYKDNPVELAQFDHHHEILRRLVELILLPLQVEETALVCVALHQASASASALIQVYCRNL